MTRGPLAAAVGRSAMLLAGRRVFIMVLLAVGTALVARFLGPAEFGQLSAALAVFALASAATDFGFSLVLGRELATDEAQRGRLLRAGVRAQTAWSLLITLIVAGIAVASGLDSLRGQILLILLPAVAISGLLGTRQVFLVLYRTQHLALIDVVTNVLQVGAMIAVAASGGGPVAIAVTMSAGAVLNTVVVAIAGLRLVDRRRPDRALLGWVFKAALPLGVASFLSTAYSAIDLVLLGWLVTGAALGQYAAAAKLFSLMTVIPGLVMAAALPGLSSVRRDRRQLSELVARVWHWLAASALPICAGAAVFAEPIVEIAFGPGYEGAVAVVRIFALAGVLSILASMIDTLMAAESMGRALVAKNVCALVVNVGGNLALVPSYGVKASAWVTVATEFVVCLIGLALLRGRLSPLPAAGVMPGPLVAIAASVIAGLALAPWPLVAVPVFVVVFVGLLFLLRAWPEEFWPLGSTASSSA